MTNYVELYTLAWFMTVAVVASPTRVGKMQYCVLAGRQRGPVGVTKTEGHGLVKMAGKQDTSVL